MSDPQNPDIIPVPPWMTGQLDWCTGQQVQGVGWVVLSDLLSRRGPTRAWCHT